MWQGNSSLSAASPKIIDLIDADSGRQFSAMEAIGADRDRALRLYKQLHLARKTGENAFLCALCSIPVYMVSAPDGEHFFFRHYQEDGSCPSITRGQLSEAQINALRYQGQRESKRHIRIKELVAESIRQDPFFTEPVVEGTWKGKEGKEFRRPDVRATFGAKSLEIAFEVQLSTTFARVMAEREVFYKSQGALLLWVFGEFHLESARLMMEVIFANNNRNAFVVDERTLEASMRDGILTLECIWDQPSIHDGGIIWTPQRRLARFDELTIDTENQRVFLVDTDRLETELREALAGPPLGSEFVSYWLDFEGFTNYRFETAAELYAGWDNLVRRFEARGIELPSRSDTKFRTVVRALLMARLGQVVGWEFKELWDAAHHMHASSKELLWIFLRAMEHHGRLPAIEARDKKRSWAKKMQAYREGTANGDPEFVPDNQFDRIIAIVFPELGLAP